MSLLSAPDDLKAPIRPSRMRRYSEQATTEFVRRALDQARKTLNAPPPIPPFLPTHDQLRLRIRSKDEAIDQRLHTSKRKPLPERLPEADESEVKALLKRSGIIAKYDREQVASQDIQRLRPGQWLNDEIINFYGALVMGRAESSNKENNKSKSKFLNVHYFSTFFWSKLEKDGYEKGRLAKWTKKFDIFTKDVVLIPVNHNNVHWTGAAINFRQKRVESYDSMNIYHKGVFKHLRMYIDAEHKNKKKAPFDFTGWVDYTLEDTPQQENGYDCGVFTCQFLQALSRGEEAFNFTQKDIPYLRRRMIWEVAHARLRDDDQ
ncbi:cysteine proteinase [Mucidula mucida]|nr:cysteine proteinase [Mucidula mucida]